MSEKSIYDESDEFIRGVICLDCLDLADAARHLNRAIKDGDLEAENFWLSAVSYHSNGVMRYCNELELRRIKAMREKIQKGEQIEQDAEVKKKKANKRTRMNLHEEYDYNCRFLFRRLVNMGDFNIPEEEKIFKDAKTYWEDLVKVREKLKKESANKEAKNDLVGA